MRLFVPVSPACFLTFICDGRKRTMFSFEGRNKHKIEDKEIPGTYITYHTNAIHVCHVGRLNNLEKKVRNKLMLEWNLFFTAVRASKVWISLPFPGTSSWQCSTSNDYRTVPSKTYVFDVQIEILCISQYQMCMFTLFTCTHVHIYIYLYWNHIYIYISATLGSLHFGPFCLRTKSWPRSHGKRRELHSPTRLNLRWFQVSFMMCKWKFQSVLCG